MSGWWIALLGAVASLCSTGSFVPQVLKIWREGGTRAISLRMYLVMTAGFVLWLAYGVVIGSWPVVIVNIANVALSGTILWLKLRAGKVAARRRPTPSPRARSRVDGLDHPPGSWGSGDG